MNKENLENFLMYLQDKIQECYKAETKKAIEEFLKEELK